MRITEHEKSYIVELSDRSAWGIWPADMTDTFAVATRDGTWC